MSKEFFNYIATRIIGFFEQESDNLHDGDRFCFRLDNIELVKCAYEALNAVTLAKDIQGTFEHKGSYRTFTIKLTGTEVVVAAQVDGMTDDFFATLRNIPLSTNRHPLLMITCVSPKDTIKNATRDLSDKGMPFHSEVLLQTIESSIDDAALSSADHVLLTHELKRKKSDRFADKKSLFEYKSLLTAVCTGKVSDEGWIDFRLLPDRDDLALITDAKKQEQRIEDNHREYERLDKVFRLGNLRDSLDSDYDNSFISELEGKKRRGENWYDGLSYSRILQSKAKKEHKQNNPLIINDEDIEVCYGSPVEYRFSHFIRAGGETKAKQREKHILVYNSDKRDRVDIIVSCNLPIRRDMVFAKDHDNTSFAIQTPKRVLIQIIPTGCTFANIEIKDPNSSATFKFKICVLDISPAYLEGIQTCYRIEGSGKKRRLLAEGIKEILIVNPGATNQTEDVVYDQGEYGCDYDTTLKLAITEDSISPDTGKVSFELSCGSLQIPMTISDDTVKPTALTGIRAFKRKNELMRSFEYRGDKIVMGTTPYYAVGMFDADLKKEAYIIEHAALCAIVSDKEFEAQELEVPSEIVAAYQKFLQVFQKRRTLPSLAFYDEEIIDAAENYVHAYRSFFEQVQSGDVLKNSHNDTLKLGTVYNPQTDTIAFSPVHPLNVMYQLQLLDETGLGSVRDDVVERLSSANLLPYIKGEKQHSIYEVVEQRVSPEWRYYAPVDGDRYDEIRDFVPKLVAEKIEEYYAHFRFLFKDIGENQMILNVHNLGDCKEIFLGIIRYFKKQIAEITLPEDMLNFVVNIYGDKDSLAHHNDFSTLTSLKRMKAYLALIDAKYEHNSDLAALLVNKVQYLLHKESDEEYRYSHIAFYEMLSSDTCGDSQITGLTTGTSLGGLVSGVPSVLNEGWYKTGFGMQHAPESRLNTFAALLNSMHRVAYSSSTFIPDHCITTEVSKHSSKQLNKVYSASNWVVFVDPKVDLSFFYQDELTKDLLIIHYGDQNSSASGYNAITVTRKSEQYENIIAQELAKKNIVADAKMSKEIIDFFNAINGRWLLRLISSKRALDSTFSREKMSIISAIKFAMAYYSHKDIVWIPISLEELLRVSGNAGSKKEGLLSAKNLHFEHGATCDDLLLIGIEKTPAKIFVHLHPIEVKIGQNANGVLEKAKAQVINTYTGLMQALWPEGDERQSIERKVIRNFVMQLAILSCEKMRLYGVYPEETWDLVLNECREDLLNENYEISEEINHFIGAGTIISFKQDVAIISGNIDEDNIALIQLPEKEGYEYLVKPISSVSKEVAHTKLLPPRLSGFYSVEQTGIQDVFMQQVAEYKKAIADISVDVLPISKVNDGAVETESLPVEETNSVVHTPASDASPLPSRSTNADHEICVLFGQDQNNGQPLVWHPGNTDEVFHTNTGIIGTMGTGKTQFTQSLVTQLYRERVNNVGEPNIGILIFDYKGDYNESKDNFVKATNAKVLKPYHLPYNPLALTIPRSFKPLLPYHVANTFNDTLSRVYHLGPKQSNSLLNCIKSAYAAKGILANDPRTWTLPAPTFQDVYCLYMSNDDIKKNDSLEAALSKLADFEVFEADSNKTQALFDILDGVVVVDISGYDPDIQNLIIAITLDLFYSQMQACGSSKLAGKHRQLTKMILVDEADNFLHEGFPSLKKILKEGREFGVGTILSTQFLKHFGSGEDDFSKYILTWVVHSVADLKATDIRFVFNTEANSPAENKLFGDVKKLKKHYSIVKIGNKPNPIYIKDKAFWELFLELEAQNDSKDV